MSSRPWNLRPSGPKTGQKFADDLARKKGALQSFLKSHPKWPSFFKTLTMDTDRSFLKVVDAEFKFLRDDTTVGD